MNDQQDRILLRKEGCCYLGPDYDPRKDRSGKPSPYCGRHDLHGDSLYCEEHYPMMYAKGTAVRKRPKKSRKQMEFDEIMQMIVDVHDELEAAGEFD